MTKTQTALDIAKDVWVQMHRFGGHLLPEKADNATVRRYIREEVEYRNGRVNPSERTVLIQFRRHFGYGD